MIPDLSVGEAWGFTLHPSQISGPKSVQGSGMPEPRSHQLGSCLASGCLPGNNAFLISRDTFKFHPTQNSFHTLAKDTPLYFSRLEVLLPGRALLSVQSWLGAWSLCSLDPVTPFLVYLVNIGVPTMCQALI